MLVADLVDNDGDSGDADNNGGNGDSGDADNNDDDGDGRSDGDYYD